MQDKSGPQCACDNKYFFCYKKTKLHTHTWMGSGQPVQPSLCNRPEKAPFSSKSGENHNDFKTTLLRVCNTFLRFDWLHRPQNILELPAAQRDGEGGSQFMMRVLTWKNKKQKNRGWECWLGALLWKSQLSGHSFTQIILKPTQTQRPTKTVYSSGPVYNTKLLFTPTSLDENGYNRLYFAKPASKILAVVACSAILTYVTLAS